MLDIKR